MKKSLLILALSLSTTIFAGTCKYGVDSSSLEWIAFKTPAKVAVKGTFDKVKVNFKASTSMQGLLQSTNVHIVTANVNSNNEGRDAKLVKNFFNVQGVKTIDAKLLKTGNGVADVEITMNNVKKVITMKFDAKETAMKFNGTIDLADFKMLPSLESITKACYDLHKGKTWQDVDLEFTLKTSCK
jgi:polyisoprenoid-binding protein YceI